MKILSLFNGISCGRVAFEQAKIDVERYVSYEIDIHANAIAKYNYPHDEYKGDATTADFTQYEGFDWVIGGSPCTFWSISKKDRETTSEGKGFELFSHFARAIREAQPKYFLYENNGSIHKNIKKEITKYLGVDYTTINSSLLSAQNRKRCYWVGIRQADGTYRTADIQQPEEAGLFVKDILMDESIPINTVKGKSHTITATYYKIAENPFSQFGSERGRQRVATPIRIGQYGKGGQGQRVYSVNGKSVCISANSGGKGGTTGLYKLDLPNGDYIIRKLYPTEAEKLQTLPFDYTLMGDYGEGQGKFKGILKVANINRYKAIGNGWTSLIIAHIIKEV